MRHRLVQYLAHQRVRLRLLGVRLLLDLYMLLLDLERLLLKRLGQVLADQSVTVERRLQTNELTLQCRC